MWRHLLLLVPLVIAGLLAFLLWTTALPLAMGLAMSTALVVYAAWRAKGLPAVIGAEGLRGRRAEAVSTSIRWPRPGNQSPRSEQSR